jgi:hypothetical protein
MPSFFMPDRRVLLLRVPDIHLISFGITGVSWSWKFHSGPPVGLSTEGCSARFKQGFSAELAGA